MKTILRIGILALAASAMLVAAASAGVNDTTRPAASEAVGLISDLKLSNVKWVHESVEPNTAEFLRTAASHNSKKLLRTTTPRRINKIGSMKTETIGGAQAPAPLDCSIESHPDCPPPNNTPYYCNFVNCADWEKSGSR